MSVNGKKLTIQDITQQSNNDKLPKLWKARRPQGRLPSVGGHPPLFDQELPGPYYIDLSIP